MQSFYLAALSSEMHVIKVIFFIILVISIVTCKVGRRTYDLENLVDAIF